MSPTRPIVHISTGATSSTLRDVQREKKFKDGQIMVIRGAGGLEKPPIWWSHRVLERKLSSGWKPIGSSTI